MDSCFGLGKYCFYLSTDMNDLEEALCYFLPMIGRDDKIRMEEYEIVITGSDKNRIKQHKDGLVIHTTLQDYNFEPSEPFVDYRLNSILKTIFRYIALIAEPDLISLHGGAVEHCGQSIIFIGKGKTTISLALTRKKFRYIHDEFLFFDKDKQYVFSIPETGAGTRTGTRVIFPELAKASCDVIEDGAEIFKIKEKKLLRVNKMYGNNSLSAGGKPVLCADIRIGSDTALHPDIKNGLFFSSFHHIYRLISSEDIEDTQNILDLQREVKRKFGKEIDLEKHREAIGFLLNDAEVVYANGSYISISDQLLKSFYRVWGKSELF